MYLLKKVIQLREHAHPDHEKPFLEHLEDLRTMIGRVVLTLLIAMIACFAFNKKIMAFFRYPVDQVLVTQIKSTLPENAPVPLTVERWTDARKVEHAANNLSAGAREAFFKSLEDDTLVFHARTLGVLRAAQVLAPEKQADFVENLPEDARFKAQIRALLLSKPNTDGDITGNLRMMSALKPTEGFMLSMKLSFVAGIVISFPLLLMYILQFVLPGMHQHEKKVLWPAMVVGFGLFLFGTAFAYYLVLPRALLFFAQWSGDMGISNDWRIGEYISFATQFTLLFGVSFELPVVVMVFVKLGLLTYETMSKTRSYAIVAIFIAAAVLTPTPDIMTMSLMAMPMIILYEICIWLAFYDRKKNRQREEEEARESELRLLAAEERRAAAVAAGEILPDEPVERDVDEDPTAWDAESVLHDTENADDGWIGEDADPEVTGPEDDTEDPDAWSGESILRDIDDAGPGDDGWVREDDGETETGNPVPPPLDDGPDDPAPPPAR